MNTVTDWKTTASINDPERAKLWVAIFGGNQVPIRSLFTHRADVPGHKGVECYMLDDKALNDEQLGKLIIALAKHFGLNEEFVGLHLRIGVPILASDVTVSTTDQGIPLSSMIADGDTL